MKRSIAIILAVAGLSGAAYAVQPLPAYKPLDANNPVCAYNFCADPTAVVHDGRLYLYGSNDQQEYDEKGNPDENTYGRIKQLMCISSVARHREYISCAAV